MTTIYDVARAANVSAMTVSRVINNTGKISEATRQKVQRIMKELNYVPNHTARSLVLQKTKTLFLLVSDICSPFYTLAARGAEDAASELGYKLLFGNSDEQLIKEKQYMDTILAARVDGVLISPISEQSYAHLEQLRLHHIPFILLNRDVSHTPYNSVSGDSYHGAIKAVDALTQLGHTDIVLINGPEYLLSGKSKRAGFIEGCNRNKLQLDSDSILEIDYRQKSNSSVMEEWFQRRQRLPTAIIAGNDKLAIAVIELSQKLTLQIPQHFSLISFDEITPFSESEQFLSVISQPAYQLGYQAASILIKQIISGTTRSTLQINLPVKMILRKSVAWF